MPATAPEILERHFLELRCGLLDLAAAFDRIDRSAGSDKTSADPRRKQLEEGLQILLSDGTDRAERIQLLFSDEYQEGWNQ